MATSKSSSPDAPVKASNLAGVDHRHRMALKEGWSTPAVVQPLLVNEGRGAESTLLGDINHEGTGTQRRAEPIRPGPSQQGTLGSSSRPRRLRPSQVGRERSSPPWPRWRSSASPSGPQRSPSRPSWPSPGSSGVWAYGDRDDHLDIRLVWLVWGTSGWTGQRDPTRRGGLRRASPRRLIGKEAGTIEQCRISAGNET